MNIVWAPEAERDRAAIVNYISADNPRAAARMDELFSNVIAHLSRFPYLGRVGRIEGTRELIAHPSYRLVYETDGVTVWVLALVHTARQWPP